VWSQPDAFVPWDPATPDDLALPGVSQADLLAPEEDLVADGGRLLTTANPASYDGVATFTQPLVRGGSTIWVRHPDPASWQRRYVEERATAVFGDQPARL